MFSVSIEDLGEVIGIIFPGEDEVGLFVPGSAEMVICSKEEWIASKGLSYPSLPTSDYMLTSDTISGSELRVLLHKLGVSSY